MRIQSGEGSYEAVYMYLRSLTCSFAVRQPVASSKGFRSSPSSGEK